MDKKLVDELNKQMNAEFYSSYLYFGMSAYFDSMNLKGFGNWMHVQAHEEWGHGMKFYQYLLDRGADVSLGKLDEVPTKYASALEVFEEAYKHEQKVTSLINNLVDLAQDLDDKPTGIFLQWFVTEQVEEEGSALEIIEKLKLIGDNPNGLFMMDHKLGARKKD
jgi:ferritin